MEVALRRSELFDSSKHALEKGESDLHEMCISWRTLSGLFCILRRNRGAEKTACVCGGFFLRRRALRSS